MSEPGGGSGARTGVGRSVGRGRLALGLGALVLCGASDAEPDRDAAPCLVSDVAVQVFSGSRLFDAPGERLDLLAGRQLDCSAFSARQVLAALGPALERIERARFGTPVRVHLDPALPRRQAPLAGIEVHVGRRELLVAPRSALGNLGPEVWRHELLHTIAAPPPESPGPARRLWLTLEEGLVMHVERASTHAGRTALPSDEGAIEPSDEGAIEPSDEGAIEPSDAVAIEPSDAVAIEPSALPAPVLVARRSLPAAALLADPAYDPHPLAAGLARELERGEPVVPVGAWVDCLAARPLELPARAAASDVFRAFVGRCPLAAASELSHAIGRWWVDAEPRPAELASVRNAAARAGDSR